MNKLNKMQSLDSRAGFTLMELMVYMLIAGIVAILAGQAFSDSTKMRVRTESMVEANQVAGDVTALLRQDMSLIGAKSSMESNSGSEGNSFEETKKKLVYMNPDASASPDSSSYTITKGTKNADATRTDRIRMLRLRYNSDGHYEAVEQIEWFVENGTLKRSCVTTDGSADDACPKTNASIVNIVEGVTQFEIDEAKPSTYGQVTSKRILPANSGVKTFRLVPRFGDEHFSLVDAGPAGGGETINVTGFVSNYNFENNEIITDTSKVRVHQVFMAEANESEGTWQGLCSAVSLDSAQEYEISFSMPVNNDNSRMFCPGRDHMAVGFRYVADGKRPEDLQDFLFYPPTVGGEDTGERRMRFTPKDTVKNVCMAFTFVSYSPLAASGTISLHEVQLSKVSYSVNDFSAQNITATEKQYVKSLRIRFSKKVNGEGAKNEFIIPIPSNGPRD